MKAVRACYKGKETGYGMDLFLRRYDELFQWFLLSSRNNTSAGKISVVTVCCCVTAGISTSIKLLPHRKEQRDKDSRCWQIKTLMFV